LKNMGTGRMGLQVTGTARALVEASKAVRDAAVARDFDSLARAIERREEIIAVFRSMDKLMELSTGDRNEVIAALQEIQAMDNEVKEVLETEMAVENRAIQDVATKAKVLSAYERVVPKPQRFDTHK
jgi:hypothetical protein